jgi:hypothetical protein
VVAPAIAAQLAPAALQRIHWYWKVSGAEPFQVPVFAPRELPTLAVPLIDGNELFEGATVAREDVASATPTTTSPTSPTASSARAPLRAGGRIESMIRFIANLLRR